jgi:hypothetical protein
MLIVSEAYQNYQKGALNNELTNFGGGGGGLLEESHKKAHIYLEYHSVCPPRPNWDPVKCEGQTRHVLYLSPSLRESKVDLSVYSNPFMETFQEKHRISRECP